MNVNETATYVALNAMVTEKLRNAMMNKNDGNREVIGHAVRR